MERECSSNELRNLLQAIKSSDVVESRAQLISKLSEFDSCEKSDVASLIECLTTYWEDFTCLDVSQCMLNKTILHVIAKYLGSDRFEFSIPLLALGTKASIWCGKHLKMTLMSTQDSQEEEHCNLFFQLLLEFLSLCASFVSALTRYPVPCDEALFAFVEKFMLEQLNLTKDAILACKRINSSCSEVLKVAQLVIDAVISLCQEFSQVVDWELCDASPEKDKSSIDCEEANIFSHVIDIIKCAIEKLCELGILAANDGGSLVTILNVSWKGVVTLLQLGKGALAVKVNVADIIVSIVSLVIESLRCASETWSSFLREPLSVTEARRTFVPVKFYLINAVKICSLYPCQAYLVYREITLCVLMILTFRISLSHGILFKVASEVLAELLEKTSMDLLNCLLNSALVKQELKLEIVDWLFIDHCSNSVSAILNSIYAAASMVEIFSVTCEDMPNARILLLGRVDLFLSLLRYSFDLDDDVKLLITRRLGWFLDILIDEEVYSSVLTLQLPVLYGSGKAMELVCEPMFSTILHGFKTFMIVVSSSLAWGEMEAFLLENFFHPHFLCGEVVMELWCFLVRYAEIDLVLSFIVKLCALMKSVASTESVLNPHSTLRKIARSVCVLLTYGTQSMVDWVYNSMVGDDRSQLLSVQNGALLLEGFPLNLLSDNMRSISKQRIVTDYFCFIEGFDDKTLIASSSGAFGIPVFTLSAFLQSLQVSISDADMKTLKLLVSVIRKYQNTEDKLMKDHCCKLLSETLVIISTMKHLYASDEMEEVLLQIKNLFISCPPVSDTHLYQCKPELALFIAGLGHMEMSEGDDCAKSNAVWELYHMLLREQHWALVHLAVAAFGYFAARTTCNQLWKFVPQDAALSYDMVSGNETNEERFMSELKVFLEKEMALLTITSSSDQHSVLLKEGLILKEMVKKISIIHDAMECERMEIHDENLPNKRRKLPDAMSKGVELLQSGLKVIGNGLSQWQPNLVDSTELLDNLLTHFSRLEDAIAQFVGLVGTGQVDAFSSSRE
ncbi:hypothetical protein CFOL_v3_01823 [Cephalotus follicularis]|uniref:Uncharacterized protein n=1 Tax=Cephalotus follicularis TaxID=3775 RepID=A0A1Q3ARD8_CEPFO|nr:hypothetical protein CFOL_v3_01823 [Cephalotus follicularis]